MNIDDNKVLELITTVAPSKARAFLVFEYDMSENKARLHVKDLMTEHGIESVGGKNDMEAMVRTLRENHGSVKRADLAQMMAEASGSTVSTANHMISALTFAIEYHKQETK